MLLHALDRVERHLELGSIAHERLRSAFEGLGEAEHQAGERWLDPANDAEQEDAVHRQPTSREPVSTAEQDASVAQSGRSKDAS